MCHVTSAAARWARWYVADTLCNPYLFSVILFLPIPFVPIPFVVDTFCSNTLCSIAVFVDYVSISLLSMALKFFLIRNMSKYIHTYISIYK